jgi:Flp pilus assembly protein TadG
MKMTMRSLAVLCRRFAESKRGVAAIEFAMVLPVLTVMFLGAFDAGRALSVYMKVRAATYALASITNQYSTIASTDMTQIMGASSTILAPYSTTPLAVTVSQITINSSKKATYEWSATSGGTVESGNTTVPTNLDVKNTYLIFAEVSYTYTPMFGFFSAGAITLSDNLYVTPRITSCVIYTPSSATC